MPLTPEEQAEFDILSKEFGGLSPEEARELQALESSFQKDGDGLGEALSERADIAGDISTQYRVGLKSLPKAAYQIGGKVLAGGVGDIVGAGMGAAGRGIAAADKYFGGYGAQALSAAGGAIGGIELPGGETVGEVIPRKAAEYGAEYAALAEANPEAALNLEAAVNIATLGIPSLKFGEKFIDSTTGLVKSLNSKELKALTAEELRERGGELFKEADQIGGKLKPEFWFEYMADAQKSLSKKSKLGTGMEIAAGTRQTLDKVVDEMQSVVGDTTSLLAVKEADQILGELAESSVDNMGKYTNEGKNYLSLQHQLRDKIDKAPDDMFEGGREAFDKVSEARKNWAASYRMSDIERIISNSEGALQPSTQIKNGFRRLRNNPKKFNKYSPDEQFAIKKAASTGTLEGFTKLSGSGLGTVITGSVGYAAGGPAGAAAAVPAYLFREGARATAEAMARKKGEAALRAISNRAQGLPPVYSQPYGNQALISGAGIVAPSGAVSAMQDETLAQRAQRILEARRANRGVK